jgi:DnaJ-class molecular chaperone
MADKDYYKVLGVPRNADADAIKRAYRKLAKQYHPDRNRDNPAAEKQFKEVQEAYSVLQDPEKRKLYDQFGEAGAKGGGPTGWRSGPGGAKVHTWRSGGPDIPIEDLEDLFSVFGGGGGGRGFQGAGAAGGGGSVFDQFFRNRSSQAGPGARQHAQRGTDIEHPIQLTFNQAIEGTTTELRLTDASTGQSRTISVKIPPGVADGQKIRLKGKGQPAMRGGPAGDLYIVCKVKPHPFFRREGNDLYLDLPLSLSEAALGTKVEIPTIDGRRTLTIPQGTASGSKLRLKGQGIQPAGKQPKGDLYAVIKIVPPKKPSDEQKELLEKLAETEQSSPRQDVPW